MSNSKYNEYKALHPEWSDEQIWTAIGLDMEADKVIDQKGKDINPTDPEIIKQIILGAEKWLSEVLPQIFKRVKNFFDHIIASLASWAQKGLKYIINHIGNI